MLECLSEHACFGGVQGFYRHVSAEIGLPMRFSVYQPPQAKTGTVPVLFFLAGLTCTEETFMIKAGAQQLAAELGLMLVTPDTSPRGANFPGEADHWDFGVGAGFYVDATQAPWSSHYRMYSYVTEELPVLIAQHFPADLSRQGIFGHSMGAHGALICALKKPEQYRSVSAFAPIANPLCCPWGNKALSAYLGPDKETWAAWDASELMRSCRYPGLILIDQGTADQFLDQQLHPETLVTAAKASGQQLTLRMQSGYDHGYYFISTFINDHLRHHAATLYS